MKNLTNNEIRKEIKKITKIIENRKGLTNMIYWTQIESFAAELIKRNKTENSVIDNSGDDYLSKFLRG